MGDVHPAVTKAECHLLFFLVAPSWLVGVCALLPEKVKERGMKKKKKHISGMGDPSLACRSQFFTIWQSCWHGKAPFGKGKIALSHEEEQLKILGEEIN